MSRIEEALRRARLAELDEFQNGSFEEREVVPSVSKRPYLVRDIAASPVAHEPVAVAEPIAAPEPPPVEVPPPAPVIAAVPPPASQPHAPLAVKPAQAEPLTRDATPKAVADTRPDPT